MICYCNFLAQCVQIIRTFISLSIYLLLDVTSKNRLKPNRETWVAFVRHPFVLMMRPGSVVCRNCSTFRELWAVQLFCWYQMFSKLMLTSRIAGVIWFHKKCNYLLVFRWKWFNVESHKIPVHKLIFWEYSVRWGILRWRLPPSIPPLQQDYKYYAIFSSK